MLFKNNGNCGECKCWEDWTDKFLHNWPKFKECVYHHGYLNEFLEMRFLSKTKKTRKKNENFSGEFTFLEFSWRVAWDVVLSPIHGYKTNFIRSPLLKLPITTVLIVFIPCTNLVFFCSLFLFWFPLSSNPRCKKCSPPHHISDITLSVFQEY